MNVENSIRAALTAMGVDIQRVDHYAPGLADACAWKTIVYAPRIAAFLSQLMHESGGYKIPPIENLNYSAPGLRATFGRYFTDDQAKSYARNPERIANRAYAGRIGNGDEASGDGWRYRGRGLIQVTGKDNYRACGRALGLDLIATPDLLLDPVNAARSAAWYWDSRGLNAMADNGEISEISMKVGEWFWFMRGIDKAEIPVPEPFGTSVKVGGWAAMTTDRIEFADADEVPDVTRRINGGVNGLNERIALYEKAMKALS